MLNIFKDPTINKFSIMYQLSPDLFIVESLNYNYFIYSYILAYFVEYLYIILKKNNQNSIFIYYFGCFYKKDIFLLYNPY